MIYFLYSKSIPAELHTFVFNEYNKWLNILQFAVQSSLVFKFYTLMSAKANYISSFP